MFRLGGQVLSFLCLGSWVSVMASDEGEITGRSWSKAILAFLYLCDRTAVLPEGPKVRDPKYFWGLWAVIVIVACFTIRKTEESNPLSREQTDEWKGWMQIMFLMLLGNVFPKQAPNSDMGFCLSCLIE